MTFSKLTPVAGLIALALVAGCNRNDVPTSADSGPGFGGASANLALDAGRVATTLPLTLTQAGGAGGGLAAGNSAALGAGPAASGSTVQSSGGVAAPHGGVADQRLLGAADRRFMTDAAVGGIYEVAAGQVAAEHGSAGVKDYGNMLVKDHSAANDELKQLAASRGVSLPNRLPKNKQDILDRLAKAPAGSFDRQFVQQVGLKDHQHDIALFEKAARSARDAEVKAFAAKTLPTLRQHYQHAQQLQTAVRAASSPRR